MPRQDRRGAAKQGCYARFVKLQFLSQSMSIKRIKLVGYFTAETNEAWSTYGGEKNVFVCPPR
jgi:hypothetical protein